MSKYKNNGFDIAVWPRGGTLCLSFGFATCLFTLGKVMGRARRMLQIYESYIVDNYLFDLNIE